LHYAWPAFPELKSIKIYGPPTLRFGPSTSNALAEALVLQNNSTGMLSEKKQARKKIKRPRLTVDINENDYPLKSP